MQESVNQTLTSVTEPIKVEAGSSSIGFDEMEQIQKLGNREESKGKEQSNGKEKSSEEKNSKEEVKTKESKAESKEGTEESKGKASQDTKGEPKDEAPVKTFKIKNGEHEVELRSDAPFEVKIDGKIEKVKLQDLLTGYSGQASLQRKFQEYKTQKDTFEKERGEIDYAINHITTLIGEGKTKNAIQYLAEAIGADPLETWKSLNQNFKGEFEKFQNLSPEELKSRELQDELDFYKERQELARTKETQEKTLREVESWIKRVQQTNGIDDQTFAKLHDELEKTGSFTADQITPDLVAQYHQALTLDARANSLLESVKASPETRAQDVQNLKDILADPKNKDLSEEDIKLIVEEAYGDKTLKRLSKKINKLEQKHSERKTHRNPSSDPISFEQI